MKLVWERLECAGDVNPAVWRAKVPGGWLVLVSFGGQGHVTFCSDAQHTWERNEA